MENLSFSLNLSGFVVYLLFTALMRAFTLEVITSVSVPAPQVMAPLPHFRPT